MPYAPKLKESASQTAGPYVHIGCMPNTTGIHTIFDTDLGSTMITGEAKGERINIEAVIFDGSGTPVKDAMVEIWQADANGVFASPEDRICVTILDMLNVEGVVLEPAGALSVDALKDLTADIKGCEMLSISRRRVLLSALAASLSGHALAQQVSGGSYQIDEQTLSAYLDVLLPADDLTPAASALNVAGDLVDFANESPQFGQFLAVSRVENVDAARAAIHPFTVNIVLPIVFDLSHQ